MHKSKKVKGSLNEVLSQAQASPQTKSMVNDAKKAKIKQSAAKSERGFRPSPRKTRIRIMIRKRKIKTTIMTTKENKQETRIRNTGVKDNLDKKCDIIDYDKQ
jgi:hypothetical protein